MQAEPSSMQSPPVAARPARPSGTRLVIAFAMAAVSDYLGVWTQLMTPVQWAVDLATAFALFAVLRRRWVILPALSAEAIPGLGMFPFWLLVVLSVVIYDDIKPFRK